MPHYLAMNEQFNMRSTCYPQLWDDSAAVTNDVSYPEALTALHCCSTPAQWDAHTFVTCAWIGTGRLPRRFDVSDRVNENLSLTRTFARVVRNPCFMLMPPSSVSDSQHHFIFMDKMYSKNNMRKHIAVVKS